MKEISLFKKIATGSLAGLVGSFCFLRIGNRFLVSWLNLQVVIFISAAMLLTAIGYTLWWSFQKRQAIDRSSAILAFLQGVIGYGIALNLSMIGFQKLFRLQFNPPIGALDLPFSSFTPEDLTWAFFSQSRAFVCIIGSFQILGSFLLLFSRTRLTGVFVLLPVMLNIVLLNACYHFNWGESIQALVLLTALLYLLLSEYSRLVEFFFSMKSALPSSPIKSLPAKNLIRVSILVIPMFLIWTYGSPDKNPWLTGKYGVGQLTVNQRNTPVNSCSDSVLTLVYFDQGNDCVFEFNSQQRRLFGTYQWDPLDKKMTIIWRYPKNIHDTLIATLSSRDKEHPLQIDGKMGGNTFQMVLFKIR